MRTVYLLRHGKASREEPLLADHERPLMPIGICRTKAAARWLKAHATPPGLIVASHAVRAFSTAGIVAETLGYPVEKIRVEPGIYHRSDDWLEDFLAGLDDGVDTVLIAGHNPVLTQLVNRWTRPGIEVLETSSPAGFAWDCDSWTQLPLTTPRLLFHIRAKSLPNNEKEA